MWQEIAEFTLSDTWQYTAPVDGRLFRIRHLSAPAGGRALITQAIPGNALQLFDVQRLTPKPQDDLFDFVSPVGLESDRRIAVKLASYSAQSWLIGVDVLEPDNTGEEDSLLATLQALIATKEDIGVAQGLIAAHQSALNAHEQYGLLMNLQTPVDGAFYEVVQPRRLILKNNSTVYFDVTVVGRRVGGNSESAVWVFQGFIRRGANAQNTALIGVPGKSRKAADNTANFDSAIDADTTNGALRLRCKSVAGQVTNWTVRAVLTEVL
jgi:hypothetical protein